MSKETTSISKSFFPPFDYAAKELVKALVKTFISPFGIVAGIIIVIGLVVTVLRFTGGLATVTNLSDNNAWGIWIGFDLLTGVALAAGGFVTSAAVYIFGMKRYHFAVRPAILTGFLGYALVVLALNYDVGRPWRLPYPFIMRQGTTSVLFEVGACVMLYLTVLFVEFCPAALEWLGLKKLRNLIIKLTLLLTIFGVVLSTLHQSSLGSLFLIAPSKLHPLWYSSYLPVFFFISSIFAGLSMVIFESTLSHRYFADKMDEEHLKGREDMALGFGKAASLVLAGYFTIKVVGIAADNNWYLLGTSYGLWFLVELLGFVALPCFLYAVGVRDRNLKLIKWAAVWTVFGVMLNRLNVSLIAFNWHLPSVDRYFPHWMEIAISIFILTVGIVAFRVIATMMPIFYEHADYKDLH
ncbi:sulfate respiration complex protein HmcC [Thermodesulfobacteriota bacterium]